LIEDIEEAVRLGREIGYPIIIKATAGGGGKGIRIVEDEEDLVRQVAAAQLEAQNAFGNAGVYLEKFLTGMKHVEIQIIADKHGNVVHLGERDCSVQRRRQKLIEEAPCPILTPELRAEMGQAAVRAALAVNYSGAGTLEFLLSPSGDFYFMEMNTRIQVEHPVTEMITQTDLIKEMISVAEGNPLSFKQEEIQFHVGQSSVVSTLKTQIRTLCLRLDKFHSICHQVEMGFVWIVPSIQVIRFRHIMIPW